MRPPYRFYQWIKDYAIYAILPILFAIIPTLYHYSNNADKLSPMSLYRMLAFNTAIAIVLYATSLIFMRSQPVRAAIAASIFLIFFNIYGMLYRFLVYLDRIRIEHYTLLPVLVILAVYAMVLLTRWKAPVLFSIWSNLCIIVSLLLVFYLIRIVPTELNKLDSPTLASPTPRPQTFANSSSPDIYYIILDEFEGLQGMREYWKYQGVDEFAAFLKDRGFYVAEDSHGSSTDTLHQMATRLNYQEYQLDDKYIQTYFDDIANNRVVDYLKSRGYTIVAFDETKLGYGSAKPIQADYLYEYGSTSIPKGNLQTLTFSFDEFGELVIDNTMLYAMSEKHRSNNWSVSQHNSMIFFTVNNIASEGVPSPKFVYVHLLLPHIPFMYDEDGNIVDNDRFFNWNYYIDNYKFAIKVAERMVENIMKASNPANPPVIIIQSDHGARNYLLTWSGSKVMPNYPDKYKTLLLNAMYLPGYDTSNLSQNMDPINTFPIIFNYLFDDNIPLQK